MHKVVIYIGNPFMLEKVLELQVSWCLLYDLNW